MRYAHTNIISPDWRRLSEFYIEVFECRVVPPLRNQSGDWLSRGTGVQDARLEGVHLRLPGWGDEGPTLEIYTYKNILQAENPQPNRKGLGHLAFEVEDVYMTLDKAKQSGGSMCGEPSIAHIEGKGTITFVYIRDPDGNLIELQHWD